MKHLVAIKLRVLFFFRPLYCLVRDDNDISMYNEYCKSSYGFSREMELRQAKDQGVAIMIKRGGVITGFAAGIGILGLAVAKSNKDLNALIGIADAIPVSLHLLETTK
jgi:hypothetical protein